ncbi:MAG: hypothetical protein WCH01_11350 [Methylococcaceae bacterium]
MADVIQDIGLIFPRSQLNRLTLFLGGTETDEAYSTTIGEEFLDPLGIDEKFFTFDEGALNRIIENNSVNNPNGTKLTKEDFNYVQHQDRPFLIIGGVLIEPWKGGDPNNLYPLEMTPLYTGIRKFQTTASGRQIGGGYVESFAYDSIPPSKELKTDGTLNQFTIGRNKHRFTLWDVIGTSGAAPEIALDKYNIENLGFPEFRSWPVIPNQIVSFKDDVHHGDGGFLDNFGLMPLLVRQVENILVFVNTATAFDAENGDGVVDEKDIVDDVFGYFGQMPKLYPKNRVFEEKEFNNLYEAYKKNKQQGNPLVYCQKYSIMDNPNYVISSKKPDNTDYKPTICWVYLDRTEKWIKKLDVNDEVSKKISKNEGPFKNFPHYKTFAEGKKQFEIIDIDRKAVNALSQLTAWTVLESKYYLSHHLGLSVEDR